MKLAEALQERADLVVKINELKSRIYNCVLVQEGEEPLENPKALKAELDSALERFNYLVFRINITNANTFLSFERESLTELIAKKDMLKMKIAKYSEIIEEASRVNYRARGSEIKFYPTIDIVAWQKEKDEIAKQLRIIDNELQECNWTVDLMES